MLVNALARGGLAIAALGMVMLVGCRATTDRIRVLEAEKADAARRNQELVGEQAELRAELIEAQSNAESEEARRRAAEAQMDLIRRDREREQVPEEVPTVDVEELQRRLKGEGVSVYETGDGAGATIVLASDITFRPGRADLSKNAETTLERVVLALKETQGIQSLRIEGHTDSDPIRKSGWTSNRALSLARAERVRLYLASNGLQEGLMAVEGHGDTRPLDSNTTSNGKARNRRVEIVLLTR
jgi:flagellar motor protein MotB